MSNKESSSGSESLVSVRSGGLDAQLDRAVPSESASAYLMVTKGEALGRIFPLLHNTVVIGRGVDCDIQLSDPSVSSRHTRILNRPFGFDVEDLGSTNGTFVDGHPVTSGTLSSGQVLKVGGVELKLLLDRRTLPTMVLVPNLVVDPMRSQPSAPSRRQRNEDSEEAGPSFQEILGKIIRVYRVARKHFVTAAIVAAVSLAAAAVSVVLLPQGSSAQCEIKLNAEASSNPADPTAQGSGKTHGLFEFPERGFTNLGLIATTLQALGNSAPSTEESLAVSAKLKLERISDSNFIASFSEGMLTRGRYDLVKLLTSHIANYVRVEMDKALATSVKEAEFLRSQTKVAETELSGIDRELQKFKEENLSSLPESEALTLGSRAQMESRRTELSAQLSRLEGEITGVRNQIASDGPLSSGHTQTSTVYRSRLAGINEKLIELRASGLTDVHPSVVSLSEEKKLAEKLLDDEMRTGTSEIERKTSPERHALEARLQSLQSAAASARTESADLAGRIQVAKTLLTAMPRVYARLEDLLLKQKDQRKLYSELFEQLKKAEVRLQLERVSMSSRHELASPPLLLKPNKSKTAILRFAIAFAVAFMVTALVVLIRELRPMLQAAWQEAEASAQKNGGK